MEAKSLLLALVALSWAALCYADDSSLDKKSVDSDDMSLVEDNQADKRLFRYGRGTTIFRYGRAPGVFRYGKRAPVFRYGKRSDEETAYEGGDDAIKRLFRWGKRSDDAVKRIFRWGKRADLDDEMDEKRARIFRYGKRSDDEDADEYLSADMDKRRIFNFGKKDHDIDIRADSPHVPFRFGDE